MKNTIETIIEENAEIKHTYCAYRGLIEDKDEFNLPKENIPVMTEMIKKKLIEEAINQGVYDAIDLIKNF